MIFLRVIVLCAEYDAIINEPVHWKGLVCDQMISNDRNSKNNLPFFNNSEITSALFRKADICQVTLLPGLYIIIDK